MSSPAEDNAGEQRERRFEELQAELEEIVGRLERGDIPVDEALRLWRRGEEVYRLCVARLDAAEGHVEELSRAPER